LNFDEQENIVTGDMYQLNMFKKKLSLEEVSEMYYNGRCAELSAARAEEVVLSWGDILTEGEKKGGVTEEGNECSSWGVDRNQLIVGSHLIESRGKKQ
jgi:hypothetical protein